jgi:hypothetical protein
MRVFAEVLPCDGIRALLPIVERAAVWAGDVAAACSTTTCGWDEVDLRGR